MGIGRRLIDHALDSFRAEGMTHAKIETLVTNDVGHGLYTSMGFEEPCPAGPFPEGAMTAGLAPRSNLCGIHPKFRG